jgi:hypothetical protein
MKENSYFVASVCLFVCFKGGMGIRACPGSPLCLMNVSVTGKFFSANYRTQNGTQAIVTSLTMGRTFI